MATITIVILADRKNTLAEALLKALREGSATRKYRVLHHDEAQELTTIEEAGSWCIYIPSLAGRHGMIPDMQEVALIARQMNGLRSRRVLLISSALVYGTGNGRLSLVAEDYSAPGIQSHNACSSWSALEAQVAGSLNGGTLLTILRPVTVFPFPSLLGKVLRGRFIATLPGHDPTLQLLSISDLAEAVSRVVETEKAGIFNVAPDGVVPLHAAVRLVKSYRVPIPRTLQRLGRPKEALEHLRYSWTVSNQKIKDELGFTPRKSSVNVLLEHRPASNGRVVAEPQFDEFGMDRDYIKFYGKTLFRFLYKYYWRIEAAGLEHIPREGPGVLTGTHRGLMPFDGVMLLHLLAQETGRLPRFLTHPALLKFPFLSNFMAKLGGVVASQGSASRVLRSGELVGLFPEGIKGAFSYYRDAYTLRAFGRDAFVKLALENSAPIVPFLVVGSAEIFPILAKINSRAWTRYSEWPCLPITPTFPFLPVPLPSKWHIQFLPAIHVEKRYPPEAARDRSVVKAISQEVRTSMQQTWNEMVSRRRSIFRGSIFQKEAKGSEGRQVNQGGSEEDLRVVTHDESA